MNEPGQILPESIPCPQCSTDLELIAVERIEKRFTCPECERETDLTEEGEDESALELHADLLEQSEESLYRILANVEDYQYEYLKLVLEVFQARSLDPSNWLCLECDEIISSEASTCPVCSVRVRAESADRKQLIAEDIEIFIAEQEPSKYTGPATEVSGESAAPRGAKTRFFVYRHPVFGDADFKYSFETVIEGPSIGAFFVAPLWTLAKGLWGWSAALWTASLSIGFMELFHSIVPLLAQSMFDVLQVVFSGFYLLVSVYLTAEGYKLRRVKYESEGYEYLGCFEAADREEAIAVALESISLTSAT